MVDALTATLRQTFPSLGRAIAQIVTSLLPVVGDNQPILIAGDATPPAAARPARQARLSVPSSAGRPAGPGRSWEEGEMSSRLSTRRPGGARRIVAVVCVVALAILASSCSSPRPTTPKSASPAAASLRALE